MQLLQKGDIIRLEKGMEVYAEIPKNVYFCNRPFSTETTEQAIEIGRIYRSDEVSKDSLISDIMKSINSHIPVTKEQVTALVDSLNLDFSAKEFDTSIYAGEYVVDWAISNGGGSQACSSGIETYPNGWHVFCTKKEDTSIHVHFYQTGCFTAMIEDIHPINSNVPEWLQGQNIL